VRRPSKAISKALSAGFVRAALREQDATSFVQFDMADRARGSGGGVQRYVGEHLWEPVADVQSEPDEVWTRSGAARRTHNAATATPQVGLPKQCCVASTRTSATARISATSTMRSG
jgi:hypothetical protein